MAAESEAQQVQNRLPNMVRELERLVGCSKGISPTTPMDAGEGADASGRSRTGPKRVRLRLRDHARA